MSTTRRPRTVPRLPGMTTYPCPRCNGTVQVCTPNAIVTCPCPTLNLPRRTVNLCRPAK